MAKKDTDLFRQLRSSGVRKKLARSVSASDKNADGALLRSADRLREVADAMERTAERPKRQRAARKAAQTRKRNAAKRSVAAQKAARTRKRSKR